MKKEKNLISTKDKLIENFTPEQLEIFEFYKSKFSYNDELLPVEENDKELMFMEKTYGILKILFKAELFFALIIVTFFTIFNLIPDTKKSETLYDDVAIIFDLDSEN